MTETLTVSVTRLIVSTQIYSNILQDCVPLSNHRTTWQTSI